MKIIEVQEARGVIVIVHGAGEHKGCYKWLIKKWNEHGFHVVIGDLPGHGETDGKRGHIDSFKEYVDTVEKWLQQARIKELPIVLLGHSMGGLTVIRTLMKRKERMISCVVLSSPCLGLSQPPPKTKEIATKIVHRITPKFSARSGIRTEEVTRNEAVRSAQIKDNLRVRKVTARWYQELSRAMRLSHRYPEEFPDIPLLVMQAGDDLVVDKSAVLSWFDQLHISEKYYKEWPELYHEIFNEPEREEVFRHAIGFVNLHVN